MTSAKWTLPVLVALLLVTGACVKRPPEADTSLPPPPVDNSIRPGDLLQITFAYAPELTCEQRVSPDGTIEMAHIGTINTTGKTPDQLRADLVAAYASQLRHPELTVTVKESLERRVYVGGEVGNPSYVPLTSNMTVLEAIMAAGGFDTTKADMSNVTVVRYKDGKQQAVKVNLTKVMQGEAVDAFYLQPRDIVYVPNKTINLYILTE